MISVSQEKEIILYISITRMRLCTANIITLSSFYEFITLFIIYFIVMLAGREGVFLYS